MRELLSTLSAMRRAQPRALYGRTLLPLAVLLLLVGFAPQLDFAGLQQLRSPRIFALLLVAIFMNLALWMQRQYRGGPAVASAKAWERAALLSALLAVLLVLSGELR